MVTGGKVTKYILRNLSKYDVNLGDLRYTIPAQQSRDLLSKTARLNYDDIMKSKENGSISKKLGQSLVEIKEIVINKVPVRKMAKNQIVDFPQCIKSSIVVDVSDVVEEDINVIFNEEEELLKQLDMYHEESSSPVFVKDEKTKT